MNNMNKKHIQNITESDDSVTITFGKSDGDNKEGDREQSGATNNVPSLSKEEKKPVEKQEQKENEKSMETKKEIQQKVTNQESTKEKLYRLFGLDQKAINEDKRTVNLAFSSEEPYDRSFGTEILSHNPQDVDFSFIASGKAPLLLNHDLEKQIGVIEKANISDADKVGRAVVRFGKSKLADEVFRDVIDGIRSNVSVGY